MAEKPERLAAGIGECCPDGGCPWAAMGLPQVCESATRIQRFRWCCGRWYRRSRHQLWMWNPYWKATVDGYTTVGIRPFAVTRGRKGRSFAIFLRDGSLTFTVVRHRGDD